jgi:transcriptional regulator GlxA family with amidase domain
MRATKDVFHVGIVLIPGFSLMAFASTVEPLRSANLMAGSLLYRWSYVSTSPGTVQASAGLDVMTAGFPSDDADFDAVVVCGALGCETYKNEKLFAFLRKCERRGALVGAISTASFVLARAGLLHNRHCTVHWDYLEAFRETYPDALVSEELFVIDRNIFTCAGGTAAMDAMLHLIRQHHGDQLAGQVADQFIHGQVRQARDSQRMTTRNRIGVIQPKLIKAIELMEQSHETQFKPVEIARNLKISSRQLERLFKRYLNSTPSKYHLKLRLERARRLLQHSHLPAMEIAVACGFTSASHFTKCYRLQFGRVPTADRQPPSPFAGK